MMGFIRRRPRQIGTWAVLALTVALVAALHASRGDTVFLKNGIVYRGTVDRDNTILWVYDGLKRVVLRDSKVAKIQSDASYRNLETFRLEQPLVVHGGSMPKDVVRVEAAPWNDRGRRMFAYEGSRPGKMIAMEQAIIELGPHLVKLRGVDGFWQGQLGTSQVPREVVLGILAKVDRTDKNERIRVARFLIQAEWYPEARSELEQILHDFPSDLDLRQRVEGARASIGQLEAVTIRAAIDQARVAQQPKQVAAMLRAFPVKDVAAELLAQVRETERADKAQAASDKALADDLRAAADRLPKAARADWETRLLEVLQSLKEAPDAVRDRFAAYLKAKAEPGAKPDALFAIAMSGYVLGADAAVDDPAVAANFWTMRDEVRGYLSGHEAADRALMLAKLEAASLPADTALPIALKKLDVVTRLARNMTPPLLEEDSKVEAKGPRIRRVKDDTSDAPTDYAVSLPPEYHPLRRYPAVVALHDGNGPQSAVAWWAAEAARRGYIVIAPEYRLSPENKEYQYSVNEHAAVELALRDAKRRYSIDDDRVFLGGQITGAHMAWDFGLAHPDLFAGLVVVSGLPFKYVYRYMPHAERVPLYVVIGDLAPAANELVFGQVLKPLIARAWDVTYSEYMKRGLEDFPEEAPAVYDWMDRRRRDPYPKNFDVMTARDCDNRFYGVVVREFRSGRTTAPEAVEPFAKNLTPATLKVTTSALSNLIKVQSSGLQNFDVWVSPKLIDFKKKLEVRINNKPFFKGMAKPDLAPLLEDLRLRGDRQQVYWLKVSTD